MERGPRTDRVWFRVGQVGLLVWLFGAWSGAGVRANPSIELMNVSDPWRTNFPGPAGGIWMIQRPTIYELNDGTSWTSGAGTGYQYLGAPVDFAVDGMSLTFTLSPAVGAPIFGWIDFNSGQHHSNGTLTATAPLILEAQIGTPVATLSGFAAVAMNESIPGFEDRFHPFAADVGDRAPFHLTYTLRDGRTWTPTIFSTSFDYDIEGYVDFAHAVPEPSMLALLCGGLMASRLPIARRGR